MTDYAKEKLYVAVSALVGPGTMGERLTYAAEPLLRLLPQDIPDEIKQEFFLLKDELTKSPLSSASGFTPRAVTDDEGKMIAQRILSMFITMSGGL